WVGTNLILLPLHNPVEVAEIGAFLDVITGGRFLLGVGLGYRPEEFALFDVPMAERVSRLVEGVEIIRRLWTEDAVVHRGRHWQLDGVTIRPRPVQQPRPPILVGSQVPAGIAPGSPTAGWSSRSRRSTNSRPRPSTTLAPGLRQGWGRVATSAACSRWCARRTRRPQSAGRRPTSSRSTRRTFPGGSRASRSTPRPRRRRSCVA